MVKHPEAASRLFGNVFVCKKCKSKIRASPLQVLQKKVRCRRCGCKSLRAIKKARVKAAAV
ncbi:MAG: hypothetical protein AB1571_03225 [Nanoarchaeota archaeon]